MLAQNAEWPGHHSHRWTACGVDPLAEGLNRYESLGSFRNERRALPEPSILFEFSMPAAAMPKLLPPSSRPEFSKATGQLLLPPSPARIGFFPGVWSLL